MAGPVNGAADSAAPARLAFVRTGVQTGERTLPAPPPAPPTEPEAEPSRSLTARLGAAVAERARGIGRRNVNRAQRFAQFVRTRTIEQWAWVAIVVLAAVLRFWGLGDKPLHHDESMHAYFSLLFAATLPATRTTRCCTVPSSSTRWALLRHHARLEWLFRQGSAVGQPVDQRYHRAHPARALRHRHRRLPCGLRRELGRVGALVAAFLLAISPTFVYFSRFLREDIYFNFFMFAMVVCAVRFATGRADEVAHRPLRRDHAGLRDLRGHLPHPRHLRRLPRAALRLGPRPRRRRAPAGAA